MHELGMCSSIVAVIERRAAERPVARVRVQVGRLHHVHPEAFEESFAVAAQGTVAQDAAAELVLLPVRASCNNCAVTWEGEDMPLACPDCGAFDFQLVGGDELLLESIEYRALAGGTAMSASPCPRSTRAEANLALGSAMRPVSPQVSSAQPIVKQSSKP